MENIEKMPTIGQLKTLNKLRKNANKKISVDESVKEKSSGGLYAILHDGTTDGDGSSLSVSSQTAIPYEDGDTLETLMEKAETMGIYDYELEEATGAWIVKEETLKEADDIWNETNYGRDSDVYMSGNETKEIAQGAAVKTI